MTDELWKTIILMIESQMVIDWWQLFWLCVFGQVWPPWPWPYLQFWHCQDFWDYLWLNCHIRQKWGASRDWRSVKWRWSQRHVSIPRSSHSFQKGKNIWYFHYTITVFTVGSIILNSGFSFWKSVNYRRFHFDIKSNHWWTALYSTLLQALWFIEIWS